MRRTGLGHSPFGQRGNFLDLPNMGFSLVFQIKPIQCNKMFLLDATKHNKVSVSQSQRILKLSALSLTTLHTPRYIQEGNKYKVSLSTSKENCIPNLARSPVTRSHKVLYGSSVNIPLKISRHNKKNCCKSC